MNRVAQSSKLPALTSQRKSIQGLINLQTTPTKADVMSTKGSEYNTTSKKVRPNRFGNLSNLPVINNLAATSERTLPEINVDSVGSPVNLRKQAKLEAPAMIDFKYQAAAVPFMSEFEIKNVGEKKVTFRFSTNKNFVLKP